MKFLMLFFGLLSLSNVTDEELFIDELNSAYDEYALIEEYENNYYDLKLYAGKVREEVYYGIYFRNKIPNEYKLKLTINNKIYVLDNTPRGDVFAPAVDFKNADEFSILIFNKYNDYQYGLTQFKNIKVMDIEEFNQLQDIYVGSGNGIKKANYKTEFNFDSRIYIYIAMVSVLLICAGIIYYYFKKSKGMFRTDLRSANVFNFKEFINSVVVETELEQEEKTWQNSHNEDLDVVEINEEKPIIESTYKWYHYEEEVSDFDIKKHLAELNLATDYSEASIEEKNKVMLELMRLRDQEKITYDDYLNEISELWKE